jgi:hypothetical protein
LINRAANGRFISACSIHERFWAKVDKNGPIPADRPDLGPCWIWTGSIRRGPNGGYGRFRMDPNTLVHAHCFSYEEARGPIPNGLVPDHLCRVRRCVNDSHLELVTNKENVLRGSGITAVQARKTHCFRGHPLSGTNLVGHLQRRVRECRICNKIRKDKFRSKGKIECLPRQHQL